MREVDTGRRELHSDNAKLAVLASQQARRVRLVSEANFQLLSRPTLTARSSGFHATALEEARHEHRGVDVGNERLGVHIEGGEGAREPRRCHHRGLGILLLQLPRIRSGVSRVHRSILFPGELSSLPLAGMVGDFRGPVESLVCFRLSAAPSLKLPSFSQAVLWQAYGAGVAPNAATLSRSLQQQAVSVGTSMSWEEGKLQRARSSSGSMVDGINARPYNSLLQEWS